MAEELQQLLEKIQHDGVEKANAEADAIIAKAKTDAARLIQEATAAADAARAKAEADAKVNATRAEETIRQAARDTVLTVKTAVTKLFEKLLCEDVKTALSDPAAVAPLALDALKELSAGSASEVAADTKLANALRAQLAARAIQGVTVVTDDTLGTGFSIRLDNGRIEHDFSDTAITTALAKRLRPALAALVK